MFDQQPLLPVDVCLGAVHQLRLAPAPIVCVSKWLNIGILRGVLRLNERETEGGIS